MEIRIDTSVSVRFKPEDWLKPIPIADCFDKPRPIEIDLGCGKGRFILARAHAHPETNFLGIDRMLRRVRRVDRKAVRRGLSNIRLLRVDGYYAVSFLIPPQSVSTYYIFFPDPWPKKKHHDHRIFNREFMDAMHGTMTADGVFHFATDHLPYFEEVLKIVGRDVRFEKTETFEPCAEEKTDFELMFIDEKPIARASFRKVS
ncbi:MAG: tRNA (guanosine(46)-N7)-methyltransferase TrmB [Verrucomicrobia bacterium]|nr:tRNA (guanosine(46)-N7)-methyltransferase TrmB [Verrucomicrobiota bacterium]